MARTPIVPVIDGIDYRQEYVQPDEEDRLLAAVDGEPWQSSVDHRVQVYGCHYSHRLRAAIAIGPLPVWARPLAVQLRRDGWIGDIPNQLVVNEYLPGDGFFDHIDQAVFGEVVLSISLGSGCAMRFVDPRTALVEELFLERGSLLSLRRDARWHWKHGIAARPVDVWHGVQQVRSRRVSLTFRLVPDPLSGPRGAGP